MATTYTVTYDFVTDTTAVADNVDQNFTDVLTALNAFDASNLASGTVPLARISGLTSTQCAAAFFKDEDDMASDSATAVSSQQAIKAYVTTQAASVWTHDGTQVYDTTAPQSWTDVDLSAYVGSNRAFVFLKCKSPDGTMELRFRTNGATEEIGYQAGASYNGAGCSGGTIAGGNIIYVTLETDASGIVELKSKEARDLDVWLEGYVK